MDDLYKKAVAGDSHAREELIARLRGRFVVLARRRIGSAEAEDLAQDTCTTIIEKLNAGHAPENFEAWAYQILRHKIGNYLQSSRVRRVERLPDEPGLVSDSQPDVQLRQSLEKCLGKLAESHPKYLRIINFMWQGYGTREICKKLDISANNLYVMLNRCRNLLKDCLKKEGKL